MAPDDGPLPPLFGLSQRLPPSNIQAEQAFLGALLANNKTLDRAQFLRPEHFAEAIHGKIFRRAVQRIEAGQVADPLTLKTDFENTGVLEEIGGVAYLLQLVSAMVAIVNAGDYAKAIYDTWLRRQLINVGEQIVNEAFGIDAAADATKMLDQAAESVLALGEASADSRGTDIATAAAGAVRRSEAAYKGMPGEARLDTGLPSLDSLIGGLWPGQLYYLMARSSTGKTPAMLQIVRHVAASLLAEAEATRKPTGHVHIFSLEMTADDLATVNLASLTRWTSDQIRAGDIGDGWKELHDAVRELGRLPIIIDDQADMDLPTLMMRARATKRQKRTRLICIDYRELIRRGREQARMQLPEWIPFLGYQLKALAKATNCPVLALAQINKSRDSAETPRPTLTDLPYDGGQAADAVYALHRPEMYMPEEPPPMPSGTSAEKVANRNSEWEQQRAKVRGVAEFHALKRRFGAKGFRILHFDGPRMLLSEPNKAPAAPDLLDHNDYPMSEADYGR
jgi:replicative DNA helicase